MANIEFPLLTKEQINVKVKQVTAKGAVALLYKDARVDMDMLDNIVGQAKWTCHYEEIKGNLFCSIAIEVESGKWVSKSDCGIESAQTDGNEKKAEASDAFKRAGFRWGIGRELYTAPFTFLKVETVQNGNKYELKDKFARFEVSEIEYAERQISRLVIVNASSGEEVFSFGYKRSEFFNKRMNVPMITDEQYDTIMTIFPPERIEGMLKAYKLNDVRGLSNAQATMIIGKRQKEIEKEDSAPRGSVIKYGESMNQ